MPRKALPPAPGPNGPEKPREGEYIPPNTAVLTLDRTRAYIRHLQGMTEQEVRDLLTNGISVKLVLINDQILKQLEILDVTVDPRERLMAVQVLNQLTAAASMITENKIKVEKALGVGLPIPNDGRQVEDKETTEEDFMKQYASDRKEFSADIAMPPIDKLPDALN